MHGRWSTIHRLKHDIQTPYHDTRYTIHTPNEHELNTHRIMVPDLENDQSASGARSSATASTRAGPVRAEASPPSAYGTSSNQCMSLFPFCFFGSYSTPCFILRASWILYHFPSCPTYHTLTDFPLTLYAAIFYLLSRWSANAQRQIRRARRVGRPRGKTPRARGARRQDGARPLRAAP